MKPRSTGHLVRAPTTSMSYSNDSRQRWVSAGYPSDMGSAASDYPPEPEYIRLYYLTAAVHALSNIVFGRLKLARFQDLNDPFELLSVQIMDKSVRKIAREFKEIEAQQTGLLCFSEDWTSPVMWSHYGERHRGICLGFDVLRSKVHDVKYDDKRLRVALEADSDPTSLPVALQEKLRRTKCHEWAYEKEQRMLVPLHEAHQVGTLHFRSFDSELRLAEVILGPNCNESLESVQTVVAHHWPSARTYRSRLAWQHFKVVPLESSVP